MHKMKNGLVILVIAMVLSLSACETMKGFGKDIQKAGKALENTADK